MVSKQFAEGERKRERENEREREVRNVKFFVLLLIIAVITVEPADKTSFVCNCMKTRLKGQYNGK